MGLILVYHAKGKKKVNVSKDFLRDRTLKSSESGGKLCNVESPDIIKPCFVAKLSHWFLAIEYQNSQVSEAVAIKSFQSQNGEAFRYSSSSYAL